LVTEITVEDFAMTKENDVPVLEKNEKAANMWSSGGRAYDEISRGVAEGIRHTVWRLEPKKDENILDIATGTGWTARCIARSGAKVTGIDIAQGLLDAATKVTEEEGLLIDFQLGDAEKLPFPDASFDAVTSTFGVMFATNQEAAITELSRVVRPGGRIAVAAWLPDSTAVELRKVVAPFVQAPPAASPPPSPFNWGDPDWMSKVLGEQFQLGYESGTLTHRLNSATEMWNVYETGFGPIRATSRALNDEDRLHLKSAFEDWLEGFRTDLGIALTYQYLVTIGVKE
jgi:ubiquinone/menaquinone biosynthesis C-methylase UbiE